MKHHLDKHPEIRSISFSGSDKSRVKLYDHLVKKFSSSRRHNIDDDDPNDPTDYGEYSIHRSQLKESLVEKGISMAALKREAIKSPCKLARFVHTDGNIFAGSAHDTTHDDLLSKAYGTRLYPYGNNLHGYLRHKPEDNSFTYDFGNNVENDHPIHARLALHKINKRPPPSDGKYYSTKEDKDFFPEETRW